MLEGELEGGRASAVERPHPDHDLDVSARHGCRLLELAAASRCPKPTLVSLERSSDLPRGVERAVERRVWVDGWWGELAVAMDCLGRVLRCRGWGCLWSVWTVGGVSGACGSRGCLWSVWSARDVEIMVGVGRLSRAWMSSCLGCAGCSSSDDGSVKHVALPSLHAYITTSHAHLDIPAAHSSRAAAIGLQSKQLSRLGRLVSAGGWGECLFSAMCLSCAITRHSPSCPSLDNRRHVPSLDDPSYGATGQGVVDDDGGRYTDLPR